MAQMSMGRGKAVSSMRGGWGMPAPRGAVKKGTLKRLLKYAFKYYKWHLITVFVCDCFFLTNSTSNNITIVDIYNAVTSALNCTVHIKLSKWLSTIGRIISTG